MKLIKETRKFIIQITEEELHTIINSLNNINNDIEESNKEQELLERLVELI